MATRTSAARVGASGSERFNHVLALATFPPVAARGLLRLGARCRCRGAGAPEAQARELVRDGDRRRRDLVRVERDLEELTGIVEAVDLATPEGDAEHTEVPEQAPVLDHPAVRRIDFEEAIGKAAAW